MRYLIAAIFSLIFAVSFGHAAFFQGAVSNNGGGGGGPVAFALPTGSTLKYMAPTGNDACNGTSPSIGSSGNCAWASPTHAMHCGEVIIAAAGNYYNSTNDMGSFGTVSNCPSTTGGIDGTGGIYAAVMLCGGSDITACKVNCHLGSPCNSPNSIPALINVAASNWAVEGFQITAGGATEAGNGSIAMQSMGCASTTHDIFFVNNFTFQVGQAYANSDVCGPGNSGSDYIGVVGNIGQAANLADFNSVSYCIAAFDIISPGKFDSGSGTHYFLYNNYTWNNIEPHCNTNFDGEDFMYDTLNNHSVTGKFVTANNLAYFATRYCINFTYGATVTVTSRFYNNTCYDDMQHPDAGDSNGGEVYTTGCFATLQIFNNIAYQPHATSGTSSTPLYAAVANPSCTYSIGGAYSSGDNNLYKGAQTTCSGDTCDAGFNVTQSGVGSTGIGTNTYANPAFNNTTDLINNQLGTPTCTGFVTTTACLGYDPNTSTLTNPSIIYDLQPTVGGSAGKGFQLPSTTCVTSGEMFNDYPPHLKGLVYLHWNGTSITENQDLATKPCNM